MRRGAGQLSATPAAAPSSNACSSAMPPSAKLLDHMQHPLEFGSCHVGSGWPKHCLQSGCAPPGLARTFLIQSAHLEWVNPKRSLPRLHSPLLLLLLLLMILLLLLELRWARF
mmetsp:Transcript_13185/g.46767  ORF Transcript_13185/g.46767 Transcript_13185/m.46767 type:complete len:113 (+) Transcript_13185:221-559(+)